MTTARRNKMHKSMNRPLTILGAERRLFFAALITGAALFNLMHSLLGGLILFVIGLIAAQWATKYDVQILRVLLNSSKFKPLYVGSGPRNGDGIPLTRESQVIFTNKYGNLDDFWIDGFFAASPESQAAGRAFLRRRDARVENRDIPINDRVQPAQFAALQEWGNPVGERFAYLKNIKIPVLIVGGKSDIIFYTINSFYLQQNLPNAQLIVYPDAAHGSLFQYPELFVEHAGIFLRG